MVEDGNGSQARCQSAPEIAQRPTSAPGSVALFSFTRQIAAVDTGIFQLGDRVGLPLRP